MKALSRNTARDALRRGIQSGVAAVMTYALTQLLDLAEVYIAILGAVLILQPSVGGTMGAAFSRLQATLAGSLLGLACLLILPDEWGTAAALLLSIIVVGGIAGLRSDWSYGAVATVASALASAGDTLPTAWNRGLAIALGAGVGVLVSLLVWPDRAEARFERHLRAAVRATATRLADAVQASMEPSREAAPPEHVSAYHKALELAQEALDVAKLVERDSMRRRLDAVRRLYNSVIILDRAAEADTPPVAVSDGLRVQVDELRRDACEVLTALADGRRDPGPWTARIDQSLRKLQEVLAEDDPSSDLHRGRNAVAFGLHEVRRNLADLIEAHPGPASSPGNRV